MPGGVLLTASRGCEECQEVLTWMLPDEEPELMAQSKYKDMVLFISNINSISTFLYWNVVVDNRCEHCTLVYGAGWLPW